MKDMEGVVVRGGGAGEVHPALIGLYHDIIQDYQLVSGLIKDLGEIGRFAIARTSCVNPIRFCLFSPHFFPLPGI